jgi:hypothetical protein
MQETSLTQVVSRAASRWFLARLILWPWRWRLQLPALKSFLHSHLCRTPLNCQPSTNWVPFHTNLLMFSSQADNLQLNYFTSLQFTELHSASLRSSLYNLAADPTENTVPPLLHTCARPCGNGTTEPLPRNGLHNPVFLLLHAFMLWALPNNGHCLQDHCLAMGLYATILTVYLIYIQETIL